MTFSSALSISRLPAASASAQTETPGASAPGVLLAVRSLPRNTSLTAIEWSDFGEEGCGVMRNLTFPSDFRILEEEDEDVLCQATG